ncbi:MAG: hypothetical protein FWB95_07100 [Treponema sp.]|nr:hypothetical protein [Treponema sp.]
MNPGFATRFCRKCLYSSLSVDHMVRFAKMTYPEYDIYESTGYPSGHPIGAQDASDRIVADMLQYGLYIDFVETLIKVESDGYMGRKFALRGLDDVIDDVLQVGYSFDSATGQFFEDQSQQVTRNWGRLIDGDERQMAVMRLDVVDNTKLVKENSKQLIDKTYGEFRDIVEGAVVGRLGRLWSWEGDGTLGAFMLGEYSRLAIFAGMEIINRIYMFNKLKNPLNAPLKLRIAVHSGNFVYSDDETECLKSDIIRKVKMLESKAAPPNSIVISESLAMAQDQALLNIFSEPKVVPKQTEKFRMYQVSMERRVQAR